MVIRWTRLLMAGLIGTVPGGGQDHREQPVALVLSSSDGRIRRSDAASELAAEVGDVLFAGDLVRTRRGSLTLLFCPDKAEYVLSPGTETLFSDNRLRVVSGNQPSRRPVAHCRLPRLERSFSAAGRHYGISLRIQPAAYPPGEPREARLSQLPAGDRKSLTEELARLDRAIAADPGNWVARLARAALLDEHGLGIDALTDYRALLGALPDTAWLRERIFHHEVLEQSKPSPAEGRTLGLVIGVSSYQPGIRPLQFAHSDAIAFANHLRTPRGGSVPSSALALLTNERATKAAVLNAFAVLRQEAEGEDTAILYFAGHGVATEKGAFVLTSDSDPENLPETSVKMQDMQYLVERGLARAGRVLIYADVCRAGKIGSLSQDNRINETVEGVGRTNPKLFGFMASQPGQSSFESGEVGGGIFTHFLLRALNGAADDDGDGKVHVYDVIDYVQTEVARMTRRKQIPRVFGGMKDIGLLADLSRPGLPLAAVTRLGTGKEAARGEVLPAPEPDGADVELFDTAIANGRLLPGAAPNAHDALAALRGRIPAASYLVLENRLRVALENRGQQILLRYLKGEETPQTRSDFVEGASYFEAARKLTPESLWLDARLSFCQGRAAVFDRQYEEAIRRLERAIRLDPQGSYAYNALGLAYLEMAAYDRAEAAFQDAIRRAPNWAYPRHNLALVYMQRGDYAAAIRVYRQAMALAPGYAYLPYNLGLIYQLTNRRKEAEQEYRRTLRCDPNHAPALNALGSLKAAQGRGADAERLFREALRVNPKLMSARQNLAVLLAGSRDGLEEATALWRANLADNPGYLASRLSLARALAAAGRVPESIREYREILRQKPDFAGARLALAGLHVMAGEPEAALRELRLAAAAQPENPQTFERIGDLEKALGRLEEARRAYQEALRQTADRGSRGRIQKKLRHLAREGRDRLAK